MGRAFVACAGFLLVACATGVEETEGFEPSTGGYGGFGGSGTASSSSSSASSSASTGGAGGEGGAPMECDFTSPNACTSALELPSIAGDEDAAPILQSGNTNKWFMIHVTEEVGSIDEEDLSYTVTLTSPPGMNYDLFVHPGPQDGGPDCLVPPLEGTGTGQSDSVSDVWDDDQGIGGEDDSRWLNIEVRWISGEACSETDLWTLSIEGHT